MSFRCHARRVRNPAVPLNLRRGSFRSCIQLYRWTGNSKRSFAEIYDRYNSEFGLDKDILEENQLVRALDALETERNLCLEKLRYFDRTRVKAKMRGRRNPSRSERALLIA